MMGRFTSYLGAAKDALVISAWIIVGGFIWAAWGLFGADNEIAWRKSVALRAKQIVATSKGVSVSDLRFSDHQDKTPWISTSSTLGALFGRQEVSAVCIVAGALNREELLNHHVGLTDAVAKIMQKRHSESGTTIYLVRSNMLEPHFLENGSAVIWVFEAGYDPLDDGCYRLGTPVLLFVTSDGVGVKMFSKTGVEPGIH